MRIESTGLTTSVLGDLQREINPQVRTVREPREQPDANVQQRIDEIIETMNETVKVFGHHLQFEAVRPNRIIIRVVDSASGQVITEIPPEKLIKAFEGMEQTLGMLLDEKS